MKIKMKEKVLFYFILKTFKINKLHWYIYSNSFHSFFLILGLNNSKCLNFN